MKMKTKKIIALVIVIMFRPRGIMGSREFALCDIPGGPPSSGRGVPPAPRADPYRRRPSAMSETAKKPVLETMHLGISFGELHAVQDFNLSIYSGELVALIGANGAGKTTTLHAISGLLRSASGSVTLDGTDLQSVPANSIIRMGLAHVPEGRHVFAQMTVEENLKMGAYTISDARLVAENMERVYGHFPRLKERRRSWRRTTGSARPIWVREEEYLWSILSLRLPERPAAAATTLPASCPNS